MLVEKIAPVECLHDIHYAIAIGRVLYGAVFAQLLICVLRRVCLEWLPQVLCNQRRFWCAHGLPHTIGAVSRDSMSCTTRSFPSSRTLGKISGCSAGSSNCQSSKTSRITQADGKFTPHPHSEITTSKSSGLKSFRALYRFNE